MKGHLIFIFFLVTLDCLGQTPKRKPQVEKHVTTKATKPSKVKRSPDELDQSIKKYITTRRSLDQINGTDYGNDIAYFTFSDNYVTITTKDVKTIYKVINVYINEWETTVYSTTDMKGNVFIWKTGLSSGGWPFVQCEGQNVKMTYTDQF